MSATPTVSVVMPVRNEERSVAGAIASVLAQSVPDLELLVVDGRSADATARVVAAIAADQPRVRLLDNPGRSIPHALNIALAAARGRYVARVDAHATINDTYLELGVATLDADQAVAAVGGRRIGVARSRAGVAVAAALSSRFGVGDSINHYAQQPQDTDHASFGVFRADAVRAVGGWDENLAVNEDVDLDHRLLAAGHRIRFDPRMCIYWQVRETLPAFARQYRRYGRGKAAMVRKNGRSAVRLRHLAPPALVVGLGGGAVATAAGLWPLGVLVAGPYAAAVAGAAVLTRRAAEPVPAPPRRRVEPAGPPPEGERVTRTAVNRTDESVTAAAGPPGALGGPGPGGGQPVGPGPATLRARLATGPVGAPGDVSQITSDRSGSMPDGAASMTAPVPGEATAGGPAGARPDTLRLAGAFAAMHLAWGFGFCEGALLGRPPALSSAAEPSTRAGRPAR